MRQLHGISVLAVMFCVTNLVRAATPTFIESADGKRVVRMDDPTLNQTYQEVTLESTGKTVCFVHGDEILTDIHAPAVLMIDDNAVRQTLAGVQLATFDGGNLRHGKDGKVEIYYKHPDLSPDFQADRTYHVNGPELNKAELVAVMYALKPEMFKLTDAEDAEQKKDMAAAGAEADRLAALDPVPGKWTFLNGHGPVDKINSGFITFGAKKGDAYPTDLDYSKGGGPTWQGVSVSMPFNGNKSIWTAYGTPKTIGLCVYEIKGGTLSGKWYPWYVDGDAKNVGTEELKGPENLEGDYTITDAKAPTTGAPYTGTVTIKPLQIVGAADDEKPFDVTWTMGTVKVHGIGIHSGKYLFVATGTGADVNIGKFDIQNGSFSGDFFKLDSTEMGGTAAMSPN